MRRWAHSGIGLGGSTMSGDHQHASAVSAGGRHKRALSIAFGLTAVFMVVEAVTGVLTGSLALLSDAGHMFTDVLGLGMAIAAIQFAESVKKPAQTYGLYRLEVLAALANSFLLFAVGAYVLYEAYGRLTEPPEVPGLSLLIVAVAGLVVNLISFRLLRQGAGESINLRGAYLEVLADMLGSFGVIVAGAIILTTGWPYADPIIGAAIGLFILPRAFRLGASALRIILEVAPPQVDVAEVERRLGALRGVVGVHDLHVWTLTSGLEAATGHLEIDGSSDLGGVLTEATELLREEFEINHVTLQCEPAGHREATQEV